MLHLIFVDLYMNEIMLLHDKIYINKRGIYLGLKHVILVYPTLILLYF